eukprot:CAMPEP_0198302074 /NCGR_PEP_ID=MMETSP1449-20131203/53869_1 /TAXON_ID=420275 /ORGANISM="Attheya septentrionalis, Strain CCMP2084" /LENGTH=57 /DNA_ID=CAMNT_0044004331 /DNA_START=160 /DNA_END=330 /DNA_ORIENTATION=-
MANGIPTLLLWFLSSSSRANNDCEDVVVVVVHMACIAKAMGNESLVSSGLLCFLGEE